MHFMLGAAGVPWLWLCMAACSFSASVAYLLTAYLVGKEALLKVEKRKVEKKQHIIILLMLCITFVAWTIIL
jgi:hypothetical protein